MKHTPLMQQYYTLKDMYNDSILLFRMGDFYETFGKDAEIVSSVLNIVLTKRDKKKDAPSLAGFPYHALDTYLPKLIKTGYKVAIAEQIGSVPSGNKIVERRVVRVITPGTILDNNILEEKQNNFIMALFKERSNIVGVAYADISTGEVKITEVSQEELSNEVRRVNPREIVCNTHVIDTTIFTTLLNVKSIRDDMYNLLIQEYKIHDLKALGIDLLEHAVVALSVLVWYLKNEIKLNNVNLQYPVYYSLHDYMLLDITTINGLNLVDGEFSLLKLLDKTCTAMGGRLLRQILLRPLLDISKINDRLNQVEFFFQNYPLAQNIRKLLKKIKDIERITRSIELHNASVWHVATLYVSLDNVDKLLNVLRDSTLLFKDNGQDSIQSIMKVINEYLDVERALQGENFAISPTINDELNKLYKIIVSADDILNQYEKGLQQSTGIQSLKIKYNKVWGHYIEVTKSNLSKVPSNFIHKQTLVNAKRFTTEKLSQISKEILTAQEQYEIHEKQVFSDLLEKLGPYIKSLYKLSNNIAKIDLCSTFAVLARDYRWVRPQILDHGQQLHIVDGRHPLVEANIHEKFIPNNLQLDDKINTYIITGPNMAGKSTYIRQNAIVVLMAQIGSFVPAKECKISIVDRVFTRVGASDDIAEGKSTFMVEMTELANILQNATNKSFVILDEIGRGTSTYDGISIAWAATEYLANEIQCRLLVATHYMELTELASLYSNIANYHTTVIEREKNKVIFAFKIERGMSSNSYGIHVANMAGIKKEVTKRAERLLQRFSLKQHSDADIIKILRPYIGKQITPIEAVNLINTILQGIRSSSK